MTIMKLGSTCVIVVSVHTYVAFNGIGGMELRILATSGAVLLRGSQGDNNVVNSQGG